MKRTNTKKIYRVAGILLSIILFFNITACGDNTKNAENNTETSDTEIEIKDENAETNGSTSTEAVIANNNNESSETTKSEENVENNEGTQSDFNSNSVSTSEESNYQKVNKNNTNKETNTETNSSTNSSTNGNGYSVTYNPISDTYEFEGITLMELYQLLGCRINESGYFYTDNTEEAVNSGIAMAESMDEFYKIIEQAVKSRSDSVDILLNIYNLDVDKYGIYREVCPSEVQKEDGSYYYFDNRWIGDERPFADYERVINSTGVNVLWSPGYNQSLHMDLKYVYFEVEFTYLTDKIYFAYTKDEVTSKINQAIKNGESRFNICRYFKTEDPDTVEYSPDCRPYIYNMIQQSTELYYNGCHILDIDYDNDEVIVLSNDGMSSGSPMWKEIRFSYEPYGYEGYENFGCVAYLSVDVRNVKEDLEVREGLTRITSIEQLTAIRNSYTYDGTVHWLGYFKGSQDEAFQMHTQMVLSGNPVSYERIADGWYYFYW